MPSKSKISNDFRLNASAPAELAGFQRWFARAASRPPAPGDPASHREAEVHLQSRNGLTAHARLAIYRRQYWLRLVACLQEGFPRALDRMGTEAFNAWAIRYLDAHPRGSPYLADLDAAFPAYLDRHYRARDRARVLEAADYDRACARAFDGAEGLAPADPARLKLTLAPHASVLDLRWDFVAGRARKRALCVYRRDGIVYEKELSRPEAAVLRALGKPRTVSALFRALEKELSPRALASVERGVGEWFRDWTEQGILSAA